MMTTLMVSRMFVLNKQEDTIRCLDHCSHGKGTTLSYAKIPLARQDRPAPHLSSAPAEGEVVKSPECLEGLRWRILRFSTTSQIQLVKQMPSIEPAGLLGFENPGRIGAIGTTYLALTS